ncbi:MAG TPA: hypothetical protein VEJ18_19655, partial [Planctomycetota bacterium]|nr:hypothetical protein [Planctomycetota bacterium]
QRVFYRHPSSHPVFGAGPMRPFIRHGHRWETPEAVDRALHWLAAQPAPDEEHAGLRLIAFLAAGHTPWEGSPPYRRLLRQEFGSLLGRQTLHPTAELALGLALECTGSPLFDHVPWTIETSPGGVEWRAWVWSTSPRESPPDGFPDDPSRRFLWLEKACRFYSPQDPRWRALFDAQVRELSAAQFADGSWGDVRTTALNVLTLCTERRFRPARRPLGPRLASPAAFPSPSQF